MVALGFSGALPYFLVFDTLSAWLRASGLSLEVIGFFSLVTLVSSFKFLWAPFVDRAQVPLLTAWLGHRRSWMLVCQLAIIAGLLLVAGSDPSRSLGAIAVFAFIVGFSSATQDIAIDAWRIESAGVSKQGAMAAAYQWGYRVAIIVAGAVPLLLANSYGWNFSYAVMAALMAIGIAGVLAAPRELRHTIRPIETAGVRPSPARDAVEWLVRLALLGVGALVLGSGLAANASVLGRVLGAVGADGARATVLAAWTSSSRVWVHFAAILIGFAIHHRRRDAAARRAHAPRRLPLVGAGRSAARLLLALPHRRRPDSRADLPVSRAGLRAQHHEPVLSGPGVHPGRDRRGPQDLRRRHDDVRRVRGRPGGGALRADAGDGDRRVRRSGEQPAVHLAGGAGAQPVRAVPGDRAGQCRRRPRRDLPDRLHVEPDVRRVHRDAVRAVLVALLHSRPADRVAVGAHRRGRGAPRGRGRRARRRA